MHNSQQYYCWTPATNASNANNVLQLSSPPHSSVIQQRTNVIVSRRSQFIDDSNKVVSHCHQQLQYPPQICGDDRNGYYSGVGIPGSEIRVDDDKDNNGVFHCQQHQYPYPPQISGYERNGDCSGVRMLATHSDADYNCHPTISDDLNEHCFSNKPASSGAKPPPVSTSTVQSRKTDNERAGTEKKRLTQSFTCQHCEKTFRHKSYFDYHLRTHTGDRPFQCSLCEKSFFERSKLNRHLSSCHNLSNGYDAGDNEFAHGKLNTCPKCHKTFSRSSGLQQHLLSHHEGCRPFSCTKCNKKFSGKTALKNHEKSHQGVKSILCDICGKAFLLKKYLDLHLNTTHKRESRKHRCASCRKEFHSEKDLKRHQLMHSNAKNFTCSLCKTSFKRKDNLNRHLKLTHLLTPEQITDELELENSLEGNQANHPTCVSNPSVVTAPPPINQVSVIKSTHEVMMSISRGEQFI